MLKNPKGSPLSVFRHYDTLARQGLPLAGPARHSVHFFEYVIFSKNFLSKNFRFSSTVKENTWHLEVFLLFLSLGYGADLGRSRLVCFFCNNMKKIALSVLRLFVSSNFDRCSFYYNFDWLKLRSIAPRPSAVSFWTIVNASKHLFLCDITFWVVAEVAQSLSRSMERLLSLRWR